MAPDWFTHILWSVPGPQPPASGVHSESDPLNSGLRFSRNAATPSFISMPAKITPNASASTAHPVRRSRGETGVHHPLDAAQSGGALAGQRPGRLEGLRHQGIRGEDLCHKADLFGRCGVPERRRSCKFPWPWHGPPGAKRRWVPPRPGNDPEVDLRLPELRFLGCIDEVATHGDLTPRRQGQTR